jgi:hypothetical protein
MSNPNYTALLFILDASGSMDGRYPMMEDALHMMLEQQARKLAGFLTVDVGYFENYATQGEQDGDPMLIHLNMFANGGTNVYDSTATLLSTFEGRLSALPEDDKPGHVVVIIMTDGDSNSAHTSEGRDVANTVRRLTADGWDFAFLSADSGALERVRGDLGIPKDCGVEEDFTEEGVAIMAHKLGEFISGVRSNERGHF